jgi:signal peptide peptidase SppA, 67K type
LRQLSEGPPSQTSVPMLVHAIDKAAHDPRIKLAVLDLDDLAGGGLPQLEEVASALQRFRAAGKKIYAWSDAYDQKSYFLAAQANQVSMSPMGMVVMQGFGVYSPYFKDALDKFGVDVHIFRVGKFKSAVEPFIRNDMSAPAREANVAFLGDLWNLYLDKLTTARKLKPGALKQYADDYAQLVADDDGDGAKLAKSSGLVDVVETSQQFVAAIEKQVGKASDGGFRSVGVRKYERAMRRAAGTDDRPVVALVTVEGDIVDGPSQPGSAGGDTISDLLDRARRDDKVKAVVLRVDSPGGSVTAAEQMREALRAVEKAGKPVVVSMSTLAASGGYWISMDADKIYARRTTITGSIGIFGIVPTFAKTLAKVGIHSDGVGTTPLTGAFRTDAPLSPAASQLIQSQINRGYQDFVDGVAKGRHLSVAQVEAIAQGRVWSGLAAKKIGLVDAFGGVRAAEAEAAKLAKLKTYQVKPVEPHPQLLQQLVHGISVQTRMRLVGLGALADSPLLGEVRRVQTLMAHLDDPHDAYAYCFCRPLGSGHVR